MQLEVTDTGGFMKSAARRMAFWGSTIVGMLGIVLAINAGLGDDYTGGGVCLAASAFAFGILGYTFVRD